MIETNTRKVVRRLMREGWFRAGGKKHDKYAHRDRPGVKIMVPRHTQLSDGVAKKIAEIAGWE